MKSWLPEVTDIEAEVDGRHFRGSYAVLLGDLVVYYNGHTSSVRKPATGMRETAVSLLQELVRQNYLPVEWVPSDLPQHMRQAAEQYANSFDDDEAIRNLIESFGPSAIGSDAHIQISWLCLNALQPIVPFWTAMCNDAAAERTLAELRAWLQNREHPIDWDSARQPLIGHCDGVRIEDCDLCSIQPIENALAKCADYLQTANIDFAVETIAEAWGAYSEGCWPQDEERPFEHWFVQVALPMAYHRQPAS